MRVRRAGEQALLLEYDDADDATGQVRTAYLRAREAGLGATDLVPAACTLLLDGLADPDATARLVASWPEGPPAATAASEAHEEPARVEIPVRYDGPDLDDLARHWDLTVAEAVALHRDTDYAVAFCGFAPGFGYCTGLPPDRAVPRRATPRPRVPAGAVGLAGEFTGVYPTASPGGWLLVGTTDLRVWDPDREQPALLAPGTRVRFVDA